MSEKPLVDTVTTGEFLEKAAGREPTPGGGGIAALVGAAASSMAEMALNFTVGAGRFADVQEKAQRYLEIARESRRRLKDLIAEDAAGYGKVAAALKLPRDTAEEKAARKKALRSAMREAIAPPLEMVRCMARLAEIMGEIAACSNPNLKGDVAVAAVLLPAAARAATLNVWANFSALEPVEREEIFCEVSETLERMEAACSRVYSKIEGELCPRQKTESS